MAEVATEEIVPDRLSPEQYLNALGSLAREFTSGELNQDQAAARAADLNAANPANAQAHREYTNEK